MKAIGKARRGALWLSLVLLLCLLPASALAETLSGNCGENGDNLTWSLNTETGVLTISGTGKMADYSIGATLASVSKPNEGLSEEVGMSQSGSGNMAKSSSSGEAPWSAYRSLVKSVLIGSGVTKIGNHAFYGSTELTDITIASSVTAIGKYAFGDCSSLTRVTLSDNMASISEGTFYACYKLSNITLPSKLISIGSYAFATCYELDDVTLPNSLISIGSFAFFNNKKLSRITIPSSVAEIGNRAFYGCAALSRVYFRGDAPKLGDSAFAKKTATLSYLSCREGWGNVTGYTKEAAIGGDCGASPGSVFWMLEGGETLQIFGTGKMADYVDAEGTWVVTPWNGYRDGIKAVSIESGVSSIGKGAFYTCYNISSVTIPSSVSAIGKRAFAGCRKLASVSIPSGVSAIEEGTFDGCDKLAFVTIPSSVSAIGKRAFACCGSLFSVSIPSGVSAIEEGTFYGCFGLASVSIPSSVSAIGKRAFAGCFGLASITIPSGVSAIEEETFDGCIGLTSITIPSSVSAIGKNAFFGCNALSSVYFHGGAPTFGEAAFEKNIVTLYALAGKSGWSFPKTDGYSTALWNPSGRFGECGKDPASVFWALSEQGVLSIDGSGAMADYAGGTMWDAYRGDITNVWIGSGVSRIDVSALSVLANLADFTVASDNMYYSSRDGILYNKAGTEIIHYPLRKAQLVALDELSDCVSELKYLKASDASVQKTVSECTEAINSATTAEEVWNALKTTRSRLTELEEALRQQRQEEYERKLGSELGAISLAAIISLLTAMISLINSLLGGMSFTF